MGREDEIKLIAYNIWEIEGCSNGRDCEHWFRAEAIWEQQKQKAGIKSSKTAPKEVVKPSSKVTAAKKAAENLIPMNLRNKSLKK